MLFVNAANKWYKSKFKEDVPEGYTWHHRGGVNPDTLIGDLELVPTKLHNKLGHTGGDAVVRGIRAERMAMEAFGGALGLEAVSKPIKCQFHHG